MEFQVWNGRPQIVRSREMIIQDLMDDLDYPDEGTETIFEREEIKKTYEALSEDELKHEWLLRFS